MFVEEKVHHKYLNTTMRNHLYFIKRQNNIHIISNEQIKDNSRSKCYYNHVISNKHIKETSRFHKYDKCPNLQIIKN